jgi:hypothetical protein
MFGPTVGHYCKPPSAAPMMHHDALCLNGFQHILKKKGGCEALRICNMYNGMNLQIWLLSTVKDVCRRGLR